MSGIGLPELVIIVVIVALMFGAPVVTFFVGYLVGKNKGTATGAAGTAPVPPSPSVPASPVADSTAPTAEEPADE